MASGQHCLVFLLLLLSDSFPIINTSRLTDEKKKEIKIFGPIQPTRVGRSSSNISSLLFLLEKLGNVDNSTHPVS